MIICQSKICLLFLQEPLLNDDMNILHVSMVNCTLIIGKEIYWNAGTGLEGEFEENAFRCLKSFQHFT